MLLGVDTKICPRRQATFYQFTEDGTDFENLLTLRACFHPKGNLEPPEPKEILSMALIMKRLDVNVSDEQINRSINSLAPFGIGRNQLLRWNIDETIDVDPRFCVVYVEFFGLAKWRHEHHLLTRNDKRFIYTAFALLGISIISWLIFEKFFNDSIRNPFTFLL